MYTKYLFFLQRLSLTGKKEMKLTGQNDENQPKSSFFSNSWQSNGLEIIGKIRIVRKYGPFPFFLLSKVCVFRVS